MGIAKTFLAIGVAILLAVFVGYAVYVFYEPPIDYNSPYTQCTAQYDCYNLTNVCYNKTDPQAPFDSSCYNQVVSSPEYQMCQKNFDACVKEKSADSPSYIHSRNSFYIIMFFALVAIIAGLFLSRMEGIGSGIMGGGVLLVLWSLIYTTQYWTTLNKYFKLIALAIVLVLLVYYGYKKLEKKPVKKRKN